MMKRVVVTYGLTILLSFGVYAQSDLHRVDFKNFTYLPFCAGDKPEKITVKNGGFSSEKPMEGYVDRFYFNVMSVAYGDLTGDRRDEAIVLTSCNTGGTGNFTEGFVYTAKAGKPSLLSRIPGGDRAYGGLRRAHVGNGLLVVESNDVGEAGGACCPEYIVTTRYQVHNDGLAEVGKAEKRELFPSQRVTFAKGTSGTTLSETIPANEGKRFVVGARSGQTLTVSVNSNKASLRLLEDATITEGVNAFTAKLPKNGNYTIEVSNYEDRDLTVTINIKIR